MCVFWLFGFVLFSWTLMKPSDREHHWPSTHKHLHEHVQNDAVGKNTEEMRKSCFVSGILLT